MWTPGRTSPSGARPAGPTVAAVAAPGALWLRAGSGAALDGW